MKDRQQDSAGDASHEELKSALHIDVNKSSSGNEMKTKSIVQSLGSAGTTMAFLPAALRNKRKSVVGSSASNKGNKQVQSRRKNPSSSGRVVKTANVVPTSSTSMNTFTIIQTSDALDSENVKALTFQDQGQILEVDEYKGPKELTDLHMHLFAQLICTIQ
jgi:hypothetical protein